MYQQQIGNKIPMSPNLFDPSYFDLRIIKNNLIDVFQKLI